MIKQKLKNNLNSTELNNYTKIKKYEILMLKVSYLWLILRQIIFSSETIRSLVS